MSRAPGEKLNNIPADDHTYQIFRILAAGKRLSMRQLMREIAAPYEYLLDPFRGLNGHTLPSKKDAARS